jgi:CRP-like cAMP-binding protein
LSSNHLFAAIAGNEMMWAPYRAMCDAFLRASRNSKVLLDVNRKLSDELLEIARRQQDLARETSEKLFDRLSRQDREKISPKQYQEAFDDLSTATVETLRELGAAFAEAQTKSVIALREQMHLLSEQQGDKNRAEAAE